MEQWILRGGRYRECMERFSVHPLLAKILAARFDTETIADFLDNDKPFYDPFLLPDMDKAVATIEHHIREGHRIRIVGDYDVDGVTSSSILYLGLTELGAKADVRIPERIGEGYGFSQSIADEILQDQIQLVITCDNGVREIERTGFLTEHQVDIVITDHHEVEKDDAGQDILPAAVAVVDPHRSDNQYPYTQICGAAVAYQLIRALRIRADYPDRDDLLLGYAALGTVCDVMPLRNENRRIVRRGFAVLNANPGVGIRALMEKSQTREITPYAAGFVLGPMLNAGGRLGSQNHYIDILVSEDGGQCRALAEELYNLNQERQQLTDEGIRQGLMQIEAQDPSQPIKVIYLPDLHESIAGLVAGKIKERIHCPIYVLTRGEAGLKGSGRSIPAYNMFQEMCKVSDVFSKFGGHPMAAGFSLAAEPGQEQAAVDHMRARLNAASTLRPEDCCPIIYIDAAVSMFDFTVSILRELEVLEPFGNGNARPLFAQKELWVKRCRLIGKNKKVLRVLLAHQGQAMEVISFRPDVFASLIKENAAPEDQDCMNTGAYLSRPFAVDICYQAEIDTYSQTPRPKFVLQHVRKTNKI